MKESADARFEDHLAIHHHQFLIEKKFHGPAQDIRFQRQAFVPDILGGIRPDVDVENILQDDRPFIEAPR